LDWSLLGALLVPLCAVPILALLGKRFGHRAGWLALPVPVISFALIVSLVTETGAFSSRVVTIPWVPSLGLSLAFVVDGLSLFFGLVVSGMGVLITFYAATYLDHHYRDHGKFYAYLMLFMASMLGCVFSENLLVLFIFWEMTSISSFLLIGFLHEKPESRDGARMALFTTGGAGLAMLAGIVLLGEAAGTYSLSALKDGAFSTVVASGGGLATWAFVLLMIGAFAKSAQFPFHYWLPNAMAAPTPVSAYLHSATMVKLGVFFIARVFPLMAVLDVWTPLLVTIGFLTMLIAAVFALVSHDLKAILAYSTVSQLGFLVGYYGMGDARGVSYDMLHIGNHVFYKGCLFMVVGIVDHAAGTRDLRKLGGLYKAFPVLGTVCIIACAAMAGIPGTSGFISKEYMLKSKFDFLTTAEALSWYPLVIVCAASVMKVAFSVRIAAHTFFGPMPQAVATDLYRPTNLMVVPPAILAIACVITGVFPDVWSPMLRAFSVDGLHVDKVIHLSLWHGVTKEFLLSAGIVGGGVLLYSLLGVVGWDRLAIPRLLRFDMGFDWLLDSVPAIAKRVTSLTRADRPMDYLPIVLLAIFLTVGGALVVNLYRLPGISGSMEWDQLFDPLRTFVVVLIGIAIVLVTRLKRWTTQLIALGVVGFLLTFYFVLFRAPDLAMTQILVEAAQLILILMLLSRFARAAEISVRIKTQSAGRRVMNVGVATIVGLTIALFTYVAASSKNADHAGQFYLERTVPDAKGSNAVNTILVDFRGFDTLMEITVLLIATLGAIGLLMRYRRTEQQFDAGFLGPQGIGVIHETDAERERRTDR
jgi:multicomponent K+:H+ antiporter subunit A/multicomponent Na+:H+ antiporter subunit A